jgi:NADH-quinone oxidoreductase subunit N
MVLSMMYGATGSLDLAEVYKATLTGEINKQVLAFGVVFIVSGLAFKLGVVPFHMWVPDVYQGAPTAVTLLVAGAPKLAAFAITIRLLVEGLINSATDWQQMLMILAVLPRWLSATWPPLRRATSSACWLTRYCAVGLHAAGLCAQRGGRQHRVGWQRLRLVAVLRADLRADHLGHLRPDHGAARARVSSRKRSRIWPVCTSAAPCWPASWPCSCSRWRASRRPWAFYAKLAVLQALITTNDPVLLTVSIVAVLLSLVAAFYYLRVIKVMYFDEPAAQAPAIQGGAAPALLSINALAVLVLGILPGALMTLCANVITQSLAG